MYSSAAQPKGKVVATGGFLNKMAGFKADGTKEPGINGYWYQLEFHQNDTITNFADRKESCTGYYLIDGSLLEKNGRGNRFCGIYS